MFTLHWHWCLTCDNNKQENKLNALRKGPPHKTSFISVLLNLHVSNIQKTKRKLSTQTHFLWLIPLWEHSPKLSYIKEKVRKLWQATGIKAFSWRSYVPCVFVYWIKRYTPKRCCKAWLIQVHSRKALFPFLPEHQFWQGRSLAGFGFWPWGTQPSSLVAVWKNRGIQHSSCWSNYKGFTLMQLCSEQKLSTWNGLLQLPCECVCLLLPNNQRFLQGDWKQV